MVGGGIGWVASYITWKIKFLEMTVSNYPSPKEMAKEVLKVKLPMSELPEDLQEKIKTMQGDIPQASTNNKLPLKTSLERDNYIG